VQMSQESMPCLHLIARMEWWVPVWEGENGKSAT
jgi:hypothetical protein